MDTVTTFFVVMIVITIISRGITAHIKAKEDAKLLDRNPEAWKTAKQLEMEKTNQNRRTMGAAAFTIAKIFLKK